MSKKTDLVQAILNNHTTYTDDTVSSAVESFFSTIKDTLSKGGRVDIRGLLSFAVKLRAARTAKNPRTGEPVDVPAKKCCDL